MRLSDGSSDLDLGSVTVAWFRQRRLFSSCLPLASSPSSPASHRRRTVSSSLRQRGAASSSPLWLRVVFSSSPRAQGRIWPPRRWILHGGSGGGSGDVCHDDNDGYRDDDGRAPRLQSPPLYHLATAAWASAGCCTPRSFLIANCTPTRPHG